MYDDADYWERWIARLLAVLAADAADQLAWAGEHGVKSVPVTDDADFVLHLAEGMAERGPSPPRPCRTSGPSAGSSARPTSEAAPACGPGH